jgi:hypothetical protein
VPALIAPISFPSAALFTGPIPDDVALCGDARPAGIGRSRREHGLSFSRVSNS